jgi:hypothetical protein
MFSFVVEIIASNFLVNKTLFTLNQKNVINLSQISINIVELKR